jgi:hypothetical protein
MTGNPFHPGHGTMTSAPPLRQVAIAFLITAGSILTAYAVLS